MSLLSENVLIDTIYALGLMICFYYAITAFACVWFFRRELRRSVRDPPSRASSRASAA